jgi:hypothetical protein
MNCDTIVGFGSFSINLVADFNVCRVLVVCGTIVLQKCIGRMINVRILSLLIFFSSSSNIVLILSIIDDICKCARTVGIISSGAKSLNNIGTSIELADISS